MGIEEGRLLLKNCYCARRFVVINAFEENGKKFMSDFTSSSAKVHICVCMYFGHNLFDIRSMILGGELWMRLLIECFGDMMGYRYPSNLRRETSSLL